MFIVGKVRRETFWFSTQKQGGVSSSSWNKFRRGQKHWFEIHYTFFL